MEISREDYERIEQMIHSADSPVGIDAKRTHVMILHLLEEIDARLQRVEAALPSR